MAVIIRGGASPPALGPGGVITISDCLSPALAHSPEIRPGRPSEGGSSQPWLNLPHTHLLPPEAPTPLHIVIPSTRFCLKNPVQWGPRAGSPHTGSEHTELFVLFSAQKSLTSEQQIYAIWGVPSLLEISGFSYFYGAFLVGPQFSMNHYMKLVRGELTDVPGKIPNR